MTDQQITVDQLIEVARTMSSTETLRRKLEKFAAQQRADATQQLQRDNLRIRRALVNCVLAVGASASDHSPIEFLELIPEEVRLSFSAKYDAIEKLRAELAAAKQQLAEAEKDAEIGSAVNRACRDLPAGHLIVIYLEKDAGDIQLQCPDDNFSRNDFEHEADTFGGQINAATDAAIAKGAEVKS